MVSANDNQMNLNSSLAKICSIEGKVIFLFKGRLPKML